MILSCLLLLVQLVLFFARLNLPNLVNLLQSVVNNAIFNNLRASFATSEAIEGVALANWPQLFGTFGPNAQQTPTF